MLQLFEEANRKESSWYILLMSTLISMNGELLHVRNTIPMEFQLASR